MNNIFKYTIETSKDIEVINIDSYIYDAIKKSNINDGICFIYIPHTTSGVTINENGDFNVRKDLEYAFKLISPKRKEYLHCEGNSHAHLLSSIIGTSEMIIIKDSKVLLGAWQSIYFCEFDGPRSRNFYIKILK